jgi:nitrite reductase/ring-hydroxylating ferredoxin subunit
MEKLCETKVIRTGSMKDFTVRGKKILVANVNNRFYAMDAVCSHMKGYLPASQITIQCY